MDSPRCPRCGARADATSSLERYRLPPEEARQLARDAAVVRRELGLATDAEAIAEATRRLARELIGA